MRVADARTQTLLALATNNPTREARVLGGAEWADPLVERKLCIVREQCGRFAVDA